MDLTLLLLMHTLNGLSLTQDDLLALLQCQPDQPGDLERCLTSDAAIQYLVAKPNWVRFSQDHLVKGADFGVRWSRIGDENYPQEWLNLSCTPPLIFSYQGEPCWKSHPLIAVVGSRTPMSDSLLWMRRELSGFLSSRRIGVVSGGARGIDQWAHRLCMDANLPTVCVLPSGLLNPYPPGSSELLSSILAGGGSVISTFALQEPMRKAAFHIRNRWITGLSPLLFVVEANRRSGSSLTAKCAKEEHRGICTLPVFPYCEQGRANLDLIMDAGHMLRDRLDLDQVWNLYSRPTLLQGSQSKQKIESIDGP